LIGYFNIIWQPLCLGSVPHNSTAHRWTHRGTKFENTATILLVATEGSTAQCFKLGHNNSNYNYYNNENTIILPII